tara:strand:+ start:1784 stop:2326 length:543 start_codon:yes stop_codon:yes gene_type:complete
MFKRISIYIGIAFMMFSCYNANKPKKPNHLINKNEMVNIIIDLKLLASANGANQKILENHGIYSANYIYKRYKTDSLTFALSNDYYAYYVDDYEEIYTKVQDSLETLNEFYKALGIQEEIEKRKKDSIEAIIKKDTLIAQKTRDSLKFLLKKDTLIGNKLKKSVKPKLIKPVLKTDLQSQ